MVGTGVPRHGTEQPASSLPAVPSRGDRAAVGLWQGAAQPVLQTASPWASLRALGSQQNAPREQHQPLLLSAQGTRGIACSDYCQSWGRTSPARSARLSPLPAPASTHSDLPRLHPNSSIHSMAPHAAVCKMLPSSCTISS